MNIEKIANYKSIIYDNEEIEKKAIAGAVAGLFKAFAPKIAELGAKAAPKIMSAGRTVANKSVGAYNSFAKAGVGKKALGGAGVGATVGAVKGSGNYNAAQDDGSFGKSRIGQVAKGALGGAAVGAAAGAALGTVTKGLKPINRVSAPPAPPTNAANGIGAPAINVPSVSNAIPTQAAKVKPTASKVNPKIDPQTGLVMQDPSQYKVSEYIDDLYFEKIAVKVSDFETGERQMDKASKKKSSKIPGTPSWVKAKELHKEAIYKRAFVGGEYGAGSTLGAESHNKNRPQYKDDPFRTTKTVAEVEAANHGLNIATDIGAAGLAAAGGFKPLFKAVKEKGWKGLKEIGKNPEFKADLGKMLKAQKYILPVGAAITGAYVGKALYDDVKHKKLKSQIHTNGPEFSQQEKNASDHLHDKELAKFVRTILADKRPDSKYDSAELKAGIAVEHEHTSSSFVAKKIAKDHLDEIPDYYTRLKFLEELAKKQQKG